MKLRPILASAVFALVIVRAYAATFTVTNLADAGQGTLRQAILDANAASGDDTITFSVSGTITLASALPRVTGSTTIDGPGTNLLTISGNNLVSVFTFNSGTTNTISGLTIADGMATNYVNGAGIANAGRLTILNCALVNNRNFGGLGGAIFNLGALAITNAAFVGNQVTGEDGLGISDREGGGGGAAGIGGGLCSMSGKVSVIGCAFANNRAIGGNGGSVSCCPYPGNGCGGGANRGCPCGIAGFGSGGGGARVNQCSGGDGGFGGGGGGGGHYRAHPPGTGGFGGGGGGGATTTDIGAGGAGAGIGGAVFVDTGEITIVDCSFTGNEAVGGRGGDGGTMYVDPIRNAARAGGNGGGIGPDFFTRAGRVLPSLTATSVGGGTVTVDPPGTPYLNRSLATVTAAPAPGWKLLFWMGDANGTNQTVSVHVTRNKYVQPVFGTQLTGSSLVSLSPQSDYYPFGTIVKLTALPPPGTHFLSWSGDASGTNNPLSITVTNPNRSFSYQLGALSMGQFTLTVVENGRGHVEASPYANRHDAGQTVTLSAVPDVAQDFLGWSGDANGSDNPLTVLMDASKTITANFTKRPTLRVGTPLEGLIEDGFRLTLQGEFGTRYSILGSTNLFDWLEAGTVTNTYGTVQLTDPAGAQLPWRFYRAVGE